MLAIHEAQIAEHGGAPGVRDFGLLQSALARPKTVKSYTDSDIPEVAAIYAIAILKNHPFVDGNKRVGAVLLETFLVLNKYELATTDAELLDAVMNLAAGTIADKKFTMWVKEHARRAKRKRK